MQRPWTGLLTYDVDTEDEPGFPATYAITAQQEWYGSRGNCLTAYVSDDMDGKFSKFTWRVDRNLGHRVLSVFSTDKGWCHLWTNEADVTDAVCSAALFGLE